MKILDTSIMDSNMIMRKIYTFDKLNTIEDIKNIMKALCSTGIDIKNIIFNYQQDHCDPKQPLKIDNCNMIDNMLPLITYDGLERIDFAIIYENQKLSGSIAPNSNQMIIQKLKINNNSLNGNNNFSEFIDNFENNFPTHHM